MESDWYGCYKRGWQGCIVDQAFEHPARFSRGLINKIYEHAFERGYLHPGEYVVDPFGGVALGALEAMRRGVNWIGVELEPHFVGYGRRNITLWNSVHSKQMPGWGTALLLEGDSRYLNQVLNGYYECVVSSSPYASGCRYTGGDDPKPELLQGGTYYGVGLSGAVASPPYTASLASGDPVKRGGLFRDEKRCTDKTLTVEYGVSNGQLGVMREGDLDAVLSSPPYLNSLKPETQEQTKRKQARIAKSKTLHDGRALEKESPGKAAMGGGYGQTQGQLGAMADDTFWSASYKILHQVFDILRPGAVAIWVTKAFVRNKKRVDFPGQWQRLCETCGFETIEWIRAWLIEDYGVQTAMFGDDVELIKQRKSFFRRLHERNGSPTIDYEVVLITQKQV